MMLFKNTSRRVILMASVATAGIGLGWLAWSTASAIPEKNNRTDSLFIPSEKNKAISFGEARAKLNGLVQEELDLSQKEFGFEYTPEDRARISGEVWDAAQLELNRRFRPIEQPKIN